MAPRARGARTRLAGCAPPGRDAGVSRPTGTFRGCLRNDAGLVPAGDNGWQHGAGIELFRRAHGMGLPRERGAVDPAALCRDRRRAVRRGATAGEGRALTYRPPGWQKGSRSLRPGRLHWRHVRHPTPAVVAGRRVRGDRPAGRAAAARSEEHTYEIQSLMRISYVV